MKLKIKNLGTHGLIKDIPGHALPLEAFTNMNNVRTGNEAVHSFLGHEVRFYPKVLPKYIYRMSDPSNSINYIIYFGENHVYTYNGINHTDISGPSRIYDSSTEVAIINNNMVITNGVTAPEYWAGGRNELVVIPEWNVTSCKVIKEFLGYLIALDVSDEGVRYPYRLKWSSQANTGIPTSWDETSASSGAGEIDLGRSNGRLVDALPLRDALYIYTENEVISMKFIGGLGIWKWDHAFGNFGILTNRCVVEFQNSHFVVSDGDVRVHNGYSDKTIIDNKNRNFLFDTMSTDHYGKTFVINNVEYDEIWICWPKQGQEYPEQALIWNYNSNTWGYRKLPVNTTSMTNGFRSVGAPLPWKDADFEWSNTERKWSQGLIAQTSDTIISASIESDSSNVMANSEFDTDEGWIVGPGCTISGGTANWDGTHDGVSYLVQDVGTPGVLYEVIYTISEYRRGAIIAGEGSGEERRSNKRYKDIVYLEEGDRLGVSTSIGFTGKISSLQCRPITVNEMDTTIQFNGTDRDTLIEKTGIDLSDYLEDDDGGEVNMITDVYPIMTGRPVIFKIGSQDTINGPMTWTKGITFDPSSDYKFDCRSTGRYHALRMESTSYWRLSAIHIKFESTGNR